MNTVGDGAFIKKPTKRVIIAGSRNYKGGVAGVARAVLASGFDIAVVISGGATGADYSGEKWAQSIGLPWVLFPADWKRYSGGAGPIRNQRMADVADALIALWDGESKGTADMINRMADKPTLVYWEAEWT